MKRYYTWLTVLIVLIILAICYGKPDVLPVTGDTSSHQTVVFDALSVGNDTLWFDLPVKYDGFRVDSLWRLIRGDSITVPSKGDYRIFWTNDSVWIRPVIVPDTAIGQEKIRCNKATYVFLDFKSAFMNDMSEWFAIADTSYLIEVRFDSFLAMTMDTLKVLTIYDPSITVVWDTSGAKHD